MLKLFLIYSLTLCLSYAISLKGCITQALKSATPIKQSRSEIEISKINHQMERVSQFGEINLVADYNHYNTPRTLAPLTPSVMQSGKAIVESKDIFSVGFVYTVPLFTGFAHTNRLKIEQIASKMALIKSRLTREEIIYNVKSLYLTILAQEELLKAQKKYHQALKRVENFIKKEWRAGKKAKIDFLKAKSQTENSLAVIEHMKYMITVTKASLSALIGIDVKRVKSIKISPKKPRYSIKSLIKRVPSLKKVSIDSMQIKKAQRAIDKVKASKLPQVNLKLYVGKNFGDDVAHDLGFRGDNIYQLGVHSSLNLVDFGKRDLQIQKAKIAKMELELKRVQLIRDIKKSIKEAVAKIEESYSLYKKSLTELKLVSKSEKIERVRYESGVSTINDLLLAKAQKQLSIAKKIESKYNYKKSLYYLDYILERGIKR